MGCDIHVHTEIKVGGQWHHYSQPRISRSYWLFALMAGVRTSEVVPQAMFPQRGLPEGLSFTTQLSADEWEADGHSHSWLTGSEMAKVIAEYDRLRYDAAKQKEDRESWFSLEHECFGYLFGNGWDFNPDEDHGEAYPSCVEDVRVIFWFDC
jgi:hypothetical protein